MLSTMSDFKFDVCNSEEEWKIVKECFIRAFYHYPLYIHIIPNEEKRTEFLRQYLEAVYDVTIRNGNAFILCLKVSKNRLFPGSESCESVTVGGVWFVRPSANGGWECAKDEDFWNAYEKYNLKNIDSEAFARILSYEKWEYDNITRRVCESGIPMWAGVLCGMDPKYTGKGLGNCVYDDCLKILKSMQGDEVGRGDEQPPEISYDSACGELSKILKPQAKTVPDFSGLLVKLIHSFAVLSHRSPVIPGFYKEKSSMANNDNNNNTIEAKSGASTIIFALSHSRGSVHFHRKNGFNSCIELPYLDTASGEAAFTTTAMILDAETGSDALNLNVIPTKPNVVLAPRSLTATQEGIRAEA